MLQTATRRRSLGQVLGVRAYGIAFLVILALLIALAIGAYSKAFTPVVHVTLETNRIGNQLLELSDVKVRGLIVGEVRSITSDGDRASVDLALNPDHVELIPANVQARLLPKTLFGEKFVSLVVPPQPADEHISEGDVIPQDRSSTAIELQQVFENLLPLLRAVQPADLAYTLNALATALEGRGERLGENLTLVNEYFTELNPAMPVIQQDISGLADLASLYADAAPDLLRLMRNQAVTLQTIVEKQDTLAAFLAGTTGFADTTTQVLSENENRIIRLGQVSRPTLEVLAKHSPVYPCLLQGMTNWIPRVDGAFSEEALHITLEVVPQRHAYQPGDEPEFNDKRGPTCYDLPGGGTYSQANPFPGTTFANGRNSGGGGGASRVPQALMVDPASGTAGTPAEQALMAALLAPQMGMGASQVPDVATLLVGPMARGTEVHQR